jgi:antitoxin YefM
MSYKGLYPYKWGGVNGHFRQKPFHPTLTRRTINCTLNGGFRMRAVSYSEARQHLSATMIQTVEDRAPVLITRQNGKSCVLMSLDEYNALEETAYLMRSPKNARRLMDSVESLQQGHGVEREMIE